ncbi:hypothetical protein ACJZ2D_002895 [Fusarium nematophilum]
MPLALQSPPLLYATSAYSAAQKAGLLTTTAGGVTDSSIARYVGISLSAFQAELVRGGCISKASLLAASLMLCLVRVSSGDIQSGSWRVHAEGAKALLASVHRSGLAMLSGPGAKLEAIIKFLSRWYLNLESLTSITRSGLLTGQCVVQDEASGVITDPPLPSLDACDDYYRYPAKVALLLREIGASAWERRQQLSGSHSHVSSDSASYTAGLQPSR